MGVEYSDSQYQKLIEFTSFKNMKETVHMPKVPIFKESMEFFRKGQIGDWKNYFTEEMTKKCDAKVAENLKYKGEIKCEPTA